GASGKRCEGWSEPGPVAGTSWWWRDRGPRRPAIRSSARRSTVRSAPSGPGKEAQGFETAGDLDDPGVTGGLRVAAVAVPLRTVVLAVHRAGDRALWARSWLVDGHEAHLALPSVEPRRL